MFESSQVSKQQVSQIGELIQVYGLAVEAVDASLPEAVSNLLVLH